MYYSHKMSLTICILTEFSNRPVAPATEATRVRHPSGPPGKPGRFPMDFLGISYGLLYGILTAYYGSKKTMDVFCLWFNDFKVFCSLLFLDPLNWMLKLAITGHGSVPAGHGGFILPLKGACNRDDHVWLYNRYTWCMNIIVLAIYIYIINIT